MNTENIALPNGTVEADVNVARLILALDDGGRLQVQLLVSTEQRGDFRFTLGAAARDALLGSAVWLAERTPEELRAAAQQLADAEGGVDV